MLAVFWCATAFSQSVEPRPIVQVGAQILTTKDLERVKQLLPFERFKTTLGTTRLIDAIYVEYMIAKAKLEAARMAAVMPEELERQMQQLQPSSTEFGTSSDTGSSAAGYTPQALSLPG